MKRELYLFFIFLFTVLFLGAAPGIADPLIPAHPETVGLQINTVASVDGLLRVNNDVGWETSTGPLDGSLSPPGPLIGEFDGIYWIIRDNPVFDIFPGVSAGEVQYSTAYREDTVALDGHVDYSNQFSLDSANRLPGTSNIEADRGIVFTTESVGSLSSSERMTLRGAGQFNFAEDTLICPFAAEQSEFIPAFCNFVEMGSDVEISTGSLSTSTQDRFIASSGDYPLAMDYRIRLSGIGDNPAAGSVSADMSGHISEGAVEVLYEVPWPPEEGTNYFVRSSLVSEMKYDEYTSAYGSITLFDKDMHYESGASR